MAKRKKPKPKSARTAAPPKPPPPALVQARQLHASGQIGPAEQAYRAALARHPKDPRVLAGLAQLRAQLGAMDEAITLLAKACDRDRTSAQLRGQLAVMRYLTGDHDGALADADRTVALDSSSVLGHSLRASCLERRHRMDEARGAAARALELDPTNVNANLVQAELERRDKAFDVAEARLTALIARPDVRGPDRADALHKLGMVLDASKRYDEAYGMLVQYARVMQDDPEVHRVDRDLWPRRIRHYAQALQSEDLERWRDYRDDDGQAAPAFLVGFSRSGTTMIEQILAAHPDVVTSGEKPVIRNTKRELSALRAGRDDLLDMARSLTPDERRQVRARFWQEAAALTERDLAGKTFVHKQPLNTIDLGLINVLFPDARVIFVLRDPRDVCVSCMMQAFVVNPANVHFLTLQDTVAFYAQTMALWQTLRATLTIPVLEVRYESVVDDLETNARALLAHLDLPWDDRVLEFQKQAAARAVSTPSYQAVTEKVNRRAVGRWRRYETQFAPLMGTLKPFVEAFGYDG